MAYNLERQLTTCEKRARHVFPENVYQVRETLFDKLDSFNIPYTDEPLRNGDYGWVFRQFNNKLLSCLCCAKQIKHDRRQPELFKKEFRCLEMICLCSKTDCCYNSHEINFKFSSNGWNKRMLEVNGDGPMSKYRKILGEVINVTSTSRGFHTIQHAVATNEQTRKRLSNFCP